MELGMIKNELNQKTDTTIENQFFNMYNFAY